MTIGRFFEDFQLGERIQHATPRTLTEGDAAQYLALYGSRFAQYCAAPYAAACGFTRTPLDPLLVFHVAFGKTVPDVSLNAVANLGYADLKFLQPVFAGDTLFVDSEVIGLKENSNGKTGVVYVQSRAQNQHGEAVLQWQRWVMVHKRDHQKPTGHNHVPATKAALNPAELPVPHGLKIPAEQAYYTGSNKTARDYKLSDVIGHGGGITIGDSDHMLATRLYQNNARVHFDAAYMQQQPAGKRLVYGGHIISICQAQSYNGFENALWLAGFNGGVHANPSFAGDTIYAASVVKAIEALSNGLSALRVVSFGIKGEPGELLASLPALADGATLPATVVLKWDYWLLLPS
jgi:2-methylfumaryl-CoA hydratase